MSAEMFVLRLLRFLLPQPVVCKVEAIRFFFAFHSFLYPLSYQESVQDVRKSLVIGVSETLCVVTALFMCNFCTK